jgi:hypothetical protein
MDGWTGAGVFRPQAWYYGFVHPEVPPMIPRAAAADVVGRLAEGVLRPRIVVDDSNFGFLHPDLPTLLGDGYQYDPERRLFVRREVVDGGSAGGGVVPWGSEHRRVRTPER